MDYEAHITIEPVEGIALETFERICRRSGFKVANLVMIKDRQVTSDRSNRDSFATGWGNSYEHTYARVTGLVEDLKAAGLKVWRYKIERTLLDVDFREPLGEPRKSAACSELAESLRG